MPNISAQTVQNFSPCSHMKTTDYVLTKMALRLSPIPHAFLETFNSATKTEA